MTNPPSRPQTLTPVRFLLWRRRLPSSKPRSSAKTPAKAIAEEVGVDEFRAELLPDEKVEAVDELLEEHETVAMVGDGINDAPAMATASPG